MLRAAPWLGVLLLAGATALLWADVAASGPLARLDAPLLRELADRREPGLTGVVQLVTDLGSGWGRCAAAAVVVGVLALRSRLPGGAPLVATAAALALAPAVDEALKALTGRARPPLEQAVSGASGLSFPSGHAMGTASVAVVLAWLVLAATATSGTAATTATAGPPRRALRALVVAAACAWALAVGASRVYLGVHWPTDVLAGWAAGAALGWAAVLLAARPGASPRAAPAGAPAP